MGVPLSQERSAFPWAFWPLLRMSDVSAGLFKVLSGATKEKFGGKIVSLTVRLGTCKIAWERSSVP